MERFNRAVRRHHVARLKRTRRYYWGWPRKDSAPGQAPGSPQDMPPDVAGKIVQNPQLCSCLACGNQRHNTAGWTPTVQERRWLVQYREQLEEAEEDAKYRTHSKV